MFVFNMPKLPWYGYLLLPISFVYGLIITCRNELYKNGHFKSVKFSLPVISVGNLSVGGTGKTPHVLYLIGLLKDHFPVGMLSRGYKRKTSGFKIVNYRDTAAMTGDEPLLIKRKYPDINVAVSEDRAAGIPMLLSQAPEIQTVILDDAYQHRGVRPSLNILLTTYSKPYYEDYILPSGRLREWPTGADRADIIIVTKCPSDITEVDRQRLLTGLSAKDQSVYFTQYGYGAPYYIFNPNYRLHWTEDLEVILLTGIAENEYLFNYVAGQVNNTYTRFYGDHHAYEDRDIDQIIEMYDNLESKKKVIVTTEKDAVRLGAFRERLVKHGIPIFAIPIEVSFLFGDQDKFNSEIKQRLLEFKY